MPLRAADVPFTGHSKGSNTRTFTAKDHAYHFDMKPVGIQFELDRVRRSSHELWGELIVKVNGNFPEAHALQDGVISAGDLNLSSVQARVTRAKLLTLLCGDKDFEFISLVEDFSIRVIAAERAGEPDVDLREAKRLGSGHMLTFEGVRLPAKHPTIIFGDGGAAKSYFALYWAGQMVERGMQVLYCDWEWTADEHAERLERLFGPAFPRVRHLEAHRSLREERDRIARIIRLRNIDYLIFDSVGVACGGDPSGSEACMSYWQTLRQFGVGSLHIAHVTKGPKDGRPDDQKPFGSAFWHNMARMTYNVRGEPLGDNVMVVGFYNRKSQWGGGSDAAFRIEFADKATRIKPTDLKSEEDLADGLPLGERIVMAVAERSYTRKEIASNLGVEYGLLQRTVHRLIKRGLLVEVESVTRGGPMRLTIPSPDLTF